MLQQYDKLDAVPRDRAKDNVPTDRQRAGFVSYVELQQVRKRLPVGSKEICALPCTSCAGRPVHDVTSCYIIYICAHIEIICLIPTTLPIGLDPEATKVSTPFHCGCCLLPISSCLSPGCDTTGG